VQQQQSRGRRGEGEGEAEFHAGERGQVHRGQAGADDPAGGLDVGDPGRAAQPVPERPATVDGLAPFVDTSSVTGALSPSCCDRYPALATRKLSVGGGRELVHDAA